MKKLIWLAVLVGIGFGGKHLFDEFRAEHQLTEARSRVSSMLKSQADGDEQTALGQWARGETRLSSDELKRLLPRYEDWARAHGLRKGMTWSVDAVELGDDQAVVEVTVDGRKHRLRVVAGQPIESGP